MNLIPRPLRRKKLAEIVEAELLEAQRKQLEAQSGLDYAQAQVAQYNDTIKRLKKLLESKELVERGELVA